METHKINQLGKNNKWGPGKIKLTYISLAFTLSVLSGSQR